MPEATLNTRILQGMQKITCWTAKVTIPGKHTHPVFDMFQNGAIRSWARCDKRVVRVFVVTQQAEAFLLFLASRSAVLGNGFAFNTVVQPFDFVFAFCNGRASCGVDVPAFVQTIVLEKDRVA